MYRMSDYEEIGGIISRMAFVPGDTATAFDFARRPRNYKSPFLEGAKAVCRASRHNETARGMIRLYCDMREDDFPGKLEDLMIFRHYYVDRNSVDTLAKVSKTGESRTVYKKIDYVARDFAVWLSNVVPLWLGASAPVVPEKLPCGGNKAVMRGNCQRCFFCNMCED